MSEKNTIFREKSLQKVSSPEDLDKYIKTTTPSLWLLLASIIVLLVGIIAWGVLGKVETYSDVGIKVSGGEATAYIKEADYEKISEVTSLVIDEQSYVIDEVNGPYEISEDSDAFLLHAADIGEGEWYYIVTSKVAATNGEYKSKIVYETISPISFIIN